jgi:hypothetical protein
MLDTADLPDDVAALKAMLIAAGNKSRSCDSMALPRMSGKSRGQHYACRCCEGDNGDADRQEW